MGDAEQAQVVTQAMAQAAGDLQDSALCEGLYQEALREAEALAVRASPSADAQRSSTLRNHGLWLAEQGRRAEAEPLLAAAVQTTHLESRGKALVAYGIFLQHGGDIEAAQRHLEQGVAMLPPQDRDALCGRSHLDAVRTGGSCGCGDTVAALASALRQIVDPHLPQGLVAELSLDERYDLRVTLAREPQDGEMEQLERVLQHGMAQLRKGIAGAR
jgi:tetratricopeptide (TPR) repeat protein